jgi:hypothetical protein
MQALDISTPVRVQNAVAVRKDGSASWMPFRNGQPGLTWPFTYSTSPHSDSLKSFAGDDRLGSFTATFGSVLWPTHRARLRTFWNFTLSFLLLDLQLHTTHRSGDLPNRPSALGSVSQLTHTVDRHALSNCVMNNISTHSFIHSMLMHSLNLTRLLRFSSNLNRSLLDDGKT